MDDRMAVAIAAAARAFADALDPPSGTGAAGPVPGSAESMRMFLRRVADVNDLQLRGVTRDEARRFAREAGMDSRGTAGYYRKDDKGLLENRGDEGRWITSTGRERLHRLEAYVPQVS